MTSRKGGASAKATEVRRDLIEVYLERLRAAGLQADRFEAVLKELISDKGARKAEVIEIASQFVGVPVSVRSRSAALQKIESKFVEIVRFEGKREMAAKGTPS